MSANYAIMPQMSYGGSMPSLLELSSLFVTVCR